jgi:hypothetical protein
VAIVIFNSALQLPINVLTGPANVLEATNEFVAAGRVFLFQIDQDIIVTNTALVVV